MRVRTGHRLSVLCRYVRVLVLYAEDTGLWPSVCRRHQSITVLLVVSVIHIMCSIHTHVFSLARHVIFFEKGKCESFEVSLTMRKECAFCNIIFSSIYPSLVASAGFYFFIFLAMCIFDVQIYSRYYFLA
jgi:hypothetical protein